jgi:hypothetical protein
MRCKQIQGATVTDLGDEAPFLPNYTAVCVNTGSSADTLQFGDASTGPFNTAKPPDGTNAVIPAGGAVEVVISGRYAAIENGAGSLVILGN